MTSKEDARPYLWVYAQDKLPLKLILDSGQTFEVMSEGIKRTVVIEYKVIKKRGRPKK